MTILQAFRSVRQASGQGLQTVISPFAELLEQSRMEIQRSLPKHLDSDRMIWLALSAFRQNEKLGECDPMSVMASVVQATQMGLEIGLNGEAYLVPFKRECQLIPGYQGLMKLARQSGYVDDIYAMEVYERDQFEIDYGAQRRLMHKPQVRSNGFPVANSERGDLCGFYAVAVLKSGQSAFIHLAKADCEQIRESSNGYQFAKRNGRLHPWVTDFVEKGKKSVIRMLTKQLPKSPHLTLALNLDSLSHEGRKQRITLQQAADGTYAPNDSHFNAPRETEDETPPAPPAPPARAEPPRGPVQYPAQASRSSGAQQPSQGAYAPRPPAASPRPPAPAPVARPSSAAPMPQQRPASAPARQQPPAQPQQRSAPVTRTHAPAGPSAQQPSARDQSTVQAAESFIKRMRECPGMDRVNDIYIEAEDRLSGAGLEAVEREYVALKNRFEPHGTRAMF